MKNKTNENELALIGASGNGDVEAVRKLLSQGVDVNIQDLPGNTPLIAASKNGHAEVIRELLSSGANVESQNQTGSTALARASRNGHVEVVGILNTEARVNTQNKKGYTPLMWASIMGHDGVIDELLKAKPDPDVRNENGDTALILASKAGRSEITKKLIGFGADPDIRNKKGNTAFREAGNKEIQQIIGGGDPVDVPSPHNAQEKSDSYRKYKIAASIAAVGLIAIFQLKNEKTRSYLAEHIESNVKCISHLKRKIKDKNYRVPANECEEAMKEILHQSGHIQEMK